MLRTCDGLILRETKYRESDKMLTILSRHDGKISASARGARAARSRQNAGTQHLAYSNFTFFENRSRITINEAEPVELFLGIRDDIEKLALASYFCEVLEALADADAGDSGMLQTALNALYALSELDKPKELIKCAFEWRIMELSGYRPTLESSCADCGEEARVFFSLSDGSVSCGGCGETGGPLRMPLCRESLDALRHILFCEPKRLLSFSLVGGALKRLCDASEAYLHAQLERGFYTLDFYKGLVNDGQR